MNVRKTIKTTQVYLSLIAMILSTAIARADIHTSLQVRYRLDESTGTTANDSSTNTGRNGTLTNGAQFISGGRVGGAVDLEPGTNQYISCPDIPATSGTTALTIAFWLYVDTLENYSQLCTKYQNFNNLVSVQLSTTDVGGNDDIEVNIHTAGTYGLVVTTGDVITEDQWLHVTVVYDDSQSGDTNKVKVYINGQLVGRTSVTALPSSLHSGSEPWRIGYRADNPGPNLGLDGKVDEFHLYTRALSQSDIQELYFQSDGSILFNGGLANPDSKLQSTTADLLQNSTEVTICAWIHPYGAGEGNAGMVAAIDEAGSAVRLRHNSGSALRLIDVRDSTDGEWTFPITNNAWNAVAITYDRVDPLNNPPRARVDFVDVVETPQEAADGQPESAGLGYCVGNLSNQTQTWAGRIAHVQVFNRLLSAAEMDGCLKKPGSVKQKLRLWLPMTGASDTADQSGNGFNGTGTALETANGPPYDPRYRFGVTDEVIGQIVIRSNGNEPALGVRGVGMRSKLTATGSLTGGARLITTEAFDIANSQVIEPTVTDLYLFGNQNLPSEPFANESLATSPVCHAVVLDSDAPTVMDCKIYDFRGNGIWVQNSTQPASRQPRMPRAQGNRISHVYTGIRAAGPDTQIVGNRVANVRDEYLLVAAGAGNCQSDGNHFFGARWAIKVATGAGPFRSVNDTFSDSTVGYENELTSTGSQIVGGFTQHCWFRNILCKAPTSISNTVVRVERTSTLHPDIVGVEFDRVVGDASRSSFIGGSIWLSETPSGATPAGTTVGMKISAYRTNVDTTIVGHGNVDYENGILVPSAIIGGTFYVKASGFGHTNDRVVKFQNAGITGTTWVIDCATADRAVEIPATWNNSNSITVIKEGVVHVLTPGIAYNGGP